MRHLAHLAARLYGVPLMLLPSAADVYGNTFQQLLEQRGALPGADAAPVVRPHAYAPNVRIERYADKPYAVTDDGIGLLGIYGPMLQRYAFDFATCDAFASYQVIKAQYERMQADEDVKAILFEGDTPGGEVAGNFELARRMLLARGGKPVWWHANEGTYSAGYSLAAATDRIVVPQAGSVGSIGVVMVHVDQSKRDEKMGVAYTFIYAGERKVDFNSHAPLSERAQAIATAEVVRLYDMLAGHVASARSLDVKVVRDTEAGVLAANDAKALGLVDAVASFDDTLAELTDLVRPKGAFPNGGPLAAATTAKGATMSHTDPAATQAAQPPQGVPEAEVAQLIAAAAEAGQKGERTRIAAILDSAPAASRPKLAAKFALASDMPAVTAIELLEAAAEETAPVPAAGASPLARAMQSVPNPAVGPDASAGAGPGDDAAATAKNVVDLFNQAKGGK